MRLKPGTRQVYIHMSRAMARQTLWDLVLEPMSRKYGLGLKLSGRDGQLMVIHPNGSSLWIVGVADRSEIEKFRGQKYYRVVIDEAQAYGPWLKELIDDSISPALLDHKGQLALTGTPSAGAVGFFHEVTTGEVKGWSHDHHWTVLDNPYVEDAAQYLLDKRIQNGWQEDHPTYQREWLGRWVYDRGALVYPFGPANVWTPANPANLSTSPFGLPGGEYRFGLGVDCGFGERSTALVLAAHRVQAGEVYLLRAQTLTRTTPDVIASRVETIRAEVRALTGEHTRVVIDEGALGAGYAQAMRELGVGCEAAEKRQKRAFQELVGGWIQQGQVRIDTNNCQELSDECSKLQWDPETGEEDKRYRRHCADAFLYIVRAMRPKATPEAFHPAHEPTPEARAAREAKATREQHIKAQIEAASKERFGSRKGGGRFT